MTVWRRQVLLGICFSVVLFLGACSKKNMAVEGAAGLSVSDRGGSADGTTKTGGSGADLSSKLAEESMVSGQRETEGSADSKRQLTKEKGLQGKEALSDAEVVSGFLPIFFEYDRAVLKRQSKMRLQENARKLLEYPNTNVVIEGHTDERGSNEYNLTLGARRARSVKQFLVALGVTADRLRIISFGEEKPFCSQSRESCWKLNRRAHFKAQS